MRTDPIYTVDNKPCPVVSAEPTPDKKSKRITYVWHQDLIRDYHGKGTGVPPFSDPARTGSHTIPNDHYEHLPRKQWSWDDDGNVTVGG